MNTEHTRSLARRYIKNRLRLDICQARVDELGGNDPVWAPLLWLAGDYVQEALQEWRTHARGKSHTELLPHILEALRDSVDEATLPYLDELPAEWLSAQVQAFVESFDPDVMLVPEGEA